MFDDSQLARSGCLQSRHIPCASTMSDDRSVHHSTICNSLNSGRAQLTFDASKHPQSVLQHQAGVMSMPRSICRFLFSLVSLPESLTAVWIARTSTAKRRGFQLLQIISLEQQTCKFPNLHQCHGECNFLCDTTQNVTTSMHATCWFKGLSCSAAPRSRTFSTCNSTNRSRHIMPEWTCQTWSLANCP